MLVDAAMLIRLAIVVAGVCVVANAICYAQCIVTSCNDPSHKQDSCHRGKPAGSDNAQKSCMHPPLSTGDWQKLAPSEPPNGIFEFICLAIPQNTLQPHES